MKKMIRKTVYILILGYFAFAFNLTAVIAKGTNSPEYTPITLKTFEPFSNDRHTHNLSQALAIFRSQVVNGKASEVRGVYVQNLFHLRVYQQPNGYSTYVFEGTGLTQFDEPKQFGVISLLAHNYYSGKLFYSLQKGMVATVIYGDGQTQDYLISAFDRYQALDPTNPYSFFIDPYNGTQLSSSQLFTLIYTTPGDLVFQTCFEEDGNPMWGRLFVTAKPIITEREP
jgi:hypothetical protein